MATSLLLLNRTNLSGFLKQIKCKLKNNNVSFYSDLMARNEFTVRIISGIQAELKFMAQFVSKNSTHFKRSQKCLENHQLSAAGNKLERVHS